MMDDLLGRYCAMTKLLRIGTPLPTTTLLVDPRTEPKLTPYFFQQETQKSTEQLGKIMTRLDLEERSFLFA